MRAIGHQQRAAGAALGPYRTGRARRKCDIRQKDLIGLSEAGNETAEVLRIAKLQVARDSLCKEERAGTAVQNLN